MFQMYSRVSLIDFFHNPEGVTRHVSLIPVAKVNGDRYWLMLSDQYREVYFSFESSRPSHGSECYAELMAMIEDTAPTLAHTIHQSIRYYPERVVIWRERVPVGRRFEDSFLLFVSIPPLSQVLYDYSPVYGYLDWYTSSHLLLETPPERYQGKLADFMDYFQHQPE